MDIFTRIRGFFRSKSKGKVNGSTSETKNAEDDLVSRGGGTGANYGGGGAGSCYGGYGGGGSSSGGYGGSSHFNPDPDPVEVLRERLLLQKEVERRTEVSNTEPGSLSLDRSTIPPGLDFQTVAFEDFSMIDRIFKMNVWRDGETGALDFSFRLETPAGTGGFGLFAVSDVRGQLSAAEEIQTGDIVLAINGSLMVGCTMRDAECLLQRGRQFELIVMKGHIRESRDYEARLGKLLQCLRQLMNTPEDQLKDESDCDEDDGMIPDEPPQLTLINRVCVPVVEELNPAADAISGADETRDEISVEDERLLHKTSSSLLTPHHRARLGDYIDSGDGDWQYVAGKCGVGQRDVNLIRNRTTSGKWTEALLIKLDHLKRTSIGMIYEALKERNRIDVIDDIIVKEIIPELRREQGAPPQYFSGFSSLSSLPPSSYSCASGCPMPSAPAVSPHYSIAQAPPPVNVIESKPVKSPFSNSSGCAVCLNVHKDSGYIYISYAQDAASVAQNVARWIAKSGYGAHYDQLDPAGIARDTVPLWKQKQIEGAKFVLILCSPGYQRQLLSPEEDGRNVSHQPGCGVSCDWMQISQEVYQRGGYGRFAPVLVNGSEVACIPMLMRNTIAFRFPEQEEDLFRRITGVAKYELPKVGPRRKLVPKREW
eukprot:m.10150 g.10150  ORF g.10150 m.10150 type:complete len:653 (+) comp21967_c0_seq2:96-2054(+)